MAAPSALSRLNFLPKPYLFRALNNFRRSQLRPKWAFPASSISKSSSMGRVSFSSVPFNSTSEEVSNEISKRDGDLIVLGIETSCDDTAAAVVRSNGEILSEVVSSQADLLVKYGGVAPKMVEEAHSQVIDQVVQEALDKAYLAEKDLSAVAVTIGPGLSLCLRGLNRINTNDMLQIRRPNMALSPNVCVMCFGSSETNSHLFLHCDVARLIWNKLFSYFEESWVCPADLGAFLAIKFAGFGRNKEHKGLWHCAILAGLWCIWLERNARIFNNRFLPPHLLWDRVTFSASLWVSAHGMFRGVSIMDLQRDWRAIMN